MTRVSKTRILLAGALVAWGAAVSAGLAALHAYEATPGRAAEPRRDWPSGTGLRFDPARANLVLLAHPRCPCTKASLEMLSRVMDGREEAVSAQVVFFQPRRSEGRWGPSALQRRAEAIPGVRVVEDRGGAEAARFGAETSGTVILYDRGGRLLFAGGITAARGQVGENAGLEAVIAKLAGTSGDPPRDFPVFGCSIR